MATAGRLPARWCRAPGSLKSPCAGVNKSSDRRIDRSQTQWECVEHTHTLLPDQLSQTGLTHTRSHTHTLLIGSNWLTKGATDWFHGNIMTAPLSQPGVKSVWFGNVPFVILGKTAALIQSESESFSSQHHITPLPLAPL